uniref:Uncharacterized protein n=1 Tax=Arundo donax TaxID=35708 RepID=A0A0A9CLD3_ARUDO
MVIAAVSLSLAVVRWLGVERQKGY